MYLTQERVAIVIYVRIKHIMECEESINRSYRTKSYTKILYALHNNNKWKTGNKAEKKYTVAKYIWDI